jgi:hypothetical protein
VRRGAPCAVVRSTGVMSAPAARRAAPARPRSGAESSAPERPATARTRAYRQRLRAGSIVVSVEVPLDVLELLLDLHWLSESESADRRQIGAAIASMLADAATARRR